MAEAQRTDPCSVNLGSEAICRFEFAVNFEFRAILTLPRKRTQQMQNSDNPFEASPGTPVRCQAFFLEFFRSLPLAKEKQGWACRGF